MNVLNLNPHTARTQRFKSVKETPVSPKTTPVLTHSTSSPSKKMPLLNGAYFGVKPLQFGSKNPSYVGTTLLINPDFITQFEDASSRPYHWGESLFESRFNQALGDFKTIASAEKPSREKLGQLQRILVKNGIVKISGPVTDPMADMVQERVNILVSIMKKTGEIRPINFLITSPGGSVLAMNSIVDTMDQAKATEINGKNIPIATYVQGYAASAASVIAANGTTGHRSMSKKAEIMIHQPLGGASGQATDMNIAVQRILHTKTEMIKFFTAVTQMQESDVTQAVERDFWMSSTDAKQKGFVDKVVTQLPSLKLTDEDEDTFTGACTESVHSTEEKGEEKEPKEKPESE